MKRGNVLTPHEAYPLTWPRGVPRTTHRESARFHSTAWRQSSYVRPGATAPESYRTRSHLTVAAATDDLRVELERLGARSPIVISSNVPLRRDGLPMSGRAEPGDPGVAVYFSLKGVETCIAIDKFDRVAANLRAISHTIAAMRGIERWGGAALVEAAFTGFQGLPAPGESSGEAWWDVLKIAPDAPRGTIEEAARVLLAQTHPDKGGTADAFIRVRTALEQARGRA